MPVLAESFWLEKAGNAPTEFEDGFSWSSPGSERPTFLAAVADGASSGMLSGPWARILCQASCQSPLPVEDLDLILSQAGNSWDSWLQEYYQMREEQNRPIRWYEEPGLRAGAYSTLCVLSVMDGQNRRWQALAIGDSCLFQLRRQQVIAIFPMTQSRAFNNTPALVPSLPQNRLKLEEHVFRSLGDWQSGDQFFLMTDALARYCLEQLESGINFWGNLEMVDTPENFSGWINSLRDQKQINNDDVTLLRISLY